MKYNFMQHLVGLILEKDLLKLFTCIIQSKGMLASNEDEHKFCAKIP